MQKKELTVVLGNYTDEDFDFQKQEVFEFQMVHCMFVFVFNCLDQSFHKMRHAPKAGNINIKSQ